MVRQTPDPPPGLVIGGETAGQFLRKTFEYEDCEECGRGAAHHIAKPDMFGNWHAWCNPRR